MSNPGDADATPITDIGQLAAHIAAGCKTPEKFRIGTEHEKFGFSAGTHEPPPYEPGGISAMLEGLAEQEPGWRPILDRGQPIGLAGGPDGASISLEPAGQLELSGGAVPTLHDTRDELAAHFAAVRRVAAPLGLGFAPLGFHPTMSRAAMPWMPKSRYAIMRRYMPLVGSMGLDMMLRTCTVQVNLDYASEADMVRKLRVALALQPLATALFANSPFTEGRPNGFLSFRAQVWTDVDNARSGIPPAFFAADFGFARYVEWLLDVPMYFILRDGRLIDVAGRSFRDFMAGRLPERPGEVATIGDFADHMTTAFTDVRIKRFLEMRGADAGSAEMMLAQSALWVGLLYDETALAAASDLVREMSWQALAALRPMVPRGGPGTPWRGGTLRDLAREVVAIARSGLANRNRRDHDGRDEGAYLDPLEAIAAGGPCQAEHWLARYHGNWGENATILFQEAQI